MSNLTDFLGGGGGGLTPKFEEFNSSGTFTPSQELIDAGGYIEVFLVGGGGNSASTTFSGAGGEAFIKSMYLSSTSGISVTIGAGGTYQGSGGSSVFSGASAGGIDLTASGGSYVGLVSNYQSPSWGARSGYSAGNGVFGYGAGGSVSGGGGIQFAKPNSGQGHYSSTGAVAGSGYCLVKWYE
jgi:hypothetical protein